MADKPSIGRRYWESHLYFRMAGIIAISMLAISLWFTWTSVQELQAPHNPHYSANEHCLDCHQGSSKHNSDATCYECHDMLSRALKDGAQEKLQAKTGGACMHPIKKFTAGDNRTVTALCLSCHKNVQGYVAMINITDKKYVEVDMSITHPIGLMPTETIHPKTLPLSRETGAINCITCHDQHGTDRRMKLLRYYYPGNGHPADFRPLCNDCHPDGWIPLTVKPTAVRRADRRE